MEENGLDYNRIVSGVVVELAKLVLEEIKGRIKRRNNPKKRKSRKRKVDSND